MLHITFSKYDCIIVHKAYYLFTCTCVSINSCHSHSLIMRYGSLHRALTPLIRGIVYSIRFCRHLILEWFTPSGSDATYLGWFTSSGSDAT